MPKQHCRHLLTNTENGHDNLKSTSTAGGDAEDGERLELGSSFSVVSIWT